MKIWLITVGEPLPTDPGKQRLLRCGIISQMLADAGHDVTWWSSTFNHVAKQHRHPSFTQEDISSNFRILQLHGCAYRRNVSLARIRNHHQIATAFAAKALARPVPDIILCSYPTIELSEEAVKYGNSHAVPVVLDVRDLWPDILLGISPIMSRPLARIILHGMYRAARNAFSGASAVIGITDAIVDWGIGYTGRKKGVMDRAFPLAYRITPLSESEALQAKEYWDIRNFGTGEFTAVFFGTLGRQFDIDTVISAARMTRDKGIRFILCGNGEYLKQHKLTAENVPNIHFPGWVNAASIQELMRRAHIGIAPYIPNDDFKMSIPNKAIEYLSAGLPIVTSLDGNLRRLVEENNCGIYYKPDDASDLANTLRRIAQDEPMRLRLSGNARRLFEREFVAERVYGRLIDYLEAIVRERCTRQLW